MNNGDGNKLQCRFDDIGSFLFFIFYFNSVLNRFDCKFHAGLFCIAPRMMDLVVGPWGRDIAQVE